MAVKEFKEHVRSVKSSSLSSDQSSVAKKLRVSNLPLSKFLELNENYRNQGEILRQQHFSKISLLQKGHMFGIEDSIFGGDQSTRLTNVTCVSEKGVLLQISREELLQRMVSQQSKHRVRQQAIIQLNFLESRIKQIVQAIIVNQHNQDTQYKQRTIQSTRKKIIASPRQKASPSKQLQVRINMKQTDFPKGKVKPFAIDLRTQKSPIFRGSPGRSKTMQQKQLDSVNKSSPTNNKNIAENKWNGSILDQTDEASNSIPKFNNFSQAAQQSLEYSQKQQISSPNNADKFIHLNRIKSQQENLTSINHFNNNNSNNNNNNISLSPKIQNNGMRNKRLSSSHIGKKSKKQSPDYLIEKQLLKKNKEFLSKNQLIALGKSSAMSSGNLNQSLTKNPLSKSHNNIEMIKISQQQNQNSPFRHESIEGFFGGFNSSSQESLHNSIEQQQVIKQQGYSTYNSNRVTEDDNIMLKQNHSLSNYLKSLTEDQQRKRGQSKNLANLSKVNQTVSQFQNMDTMSAFKKVKLSNLQSPSLLAQTLRTKYQLKTLFQDQKQSEDRSVRKVKNKIKAQQFQKAIEEATALHNNKIDDKRKDGKKMIMQHRFNKNHLSQFNKIHNENNQNVSMQQASSILQGQKSIAQMIKGSERVHYNPLKSTQILISERVQRDKSLFSTSQKKNREEQIKTPIRMTPKKRLQLNDQERKRLKSGSVKRVSETQIQLPKIQEPAIRINNESTSNTCISNSQSNRTSSQIKYRKSMSHFNLISQYSKQVKEERRKSSYNHQMHSFFENNIRNKKDTSFKEQGNLQNQIPLFEYSVNLNEEELSSPDFKNSSSPPVAAAQNKEKIQQYNDKNINKVDLKFDVISAAKNSRIGQHIFGLTKGEEIMAETLLKCKKNKLKSQLQKQGLQLNIQRSNALIRNKSAIDLSNNQNSSPRNNHINRSSDQKRINQHQRNSSLQKDKQLNRQINHHPNNKIPKDVQNRLHYTNQFKKKLSILKSGKKITDDDDIDLYDEMNQDVEYIFEQQPKNIRQKSKKYVAVKKTLESLLDKHKLYLNKHQSKFNSNSESILSSQYSTMTFRGNPLPPSSNNKKFDSKLDSSKISSSLNIRTPQSPIRAPPVVQKKQKIYSQILMPIQKIQQRQESKTQKKREIKFSTDKNIVRSFSKDSLIHQAGKQQPDSLLISKQNQYYYNFGFDYDAMRKAAGVTRLKNTHSISAFGTPERVLPLPTKTRENEKLRKERILKTAIKRQQVLYKKF